MLFTDIFNEAINIEPYRAEIHDMVPVIMTNVLSLIKKNKIDLTKESLASFISEQFTDKFKVIYDKVIDAYPLEVKNDGEILELLKHQYIFKACSKKEVTNDYNNLGGSSSARGFLTCDDHNLYCEISLPDELYSPLFWKVAINNEMVFKQNVDKCSLEISKLFIHEIQHHIQASNMGYKWFITNTNKNRSDIQDVEISYYLNPQEIDAFAAETATQIISYIEQNKFSIDTAKHLLSSTAGQKKLCALKMLSFYKSFYDLYKNTSNKDKKVYHVFLKKIMYHLNNYETKKIVPPKQNTNYLSSIVTKIKSLFNKE